MNLAARRLSACLRTALFFLAIGFPLAALAQSDVVVLKNGTQITGTITTQDGGEVRIIVGGIEQIHYMTNVREVIRGDASEIGPGEPAAQEALKRFRANQFIDAWEQYVEMDAAEGEAWRRHEDRIKATLQRLTGQMAQEALAGGDGDALDQLNRILNEDGTRNLVSKVYPENLEQFNNLIRRLAGTVHFLRGKRARLESRDPEAAELEFREAETHLQRGDPYYAELMFHYGHVILDQAEALWDRAQDGARLPSDVPALQELDRRFYEASSKWSEVRTILSGNTFPEAESRAIRSFFNEIQSRQTAVTTGREAISAKIVQIEAAARPQPTPIPTPTPVPTPVPTPSPTPSITEDPKIWFSEKFGDVLPEGLKDASIGQYAIYVAVFIVVFWMIPWAVFKILRRRIDIIADQWAKRVWFLGPVTLIGYMISFIAVRPKRIRVKKSKNPCPHCGFGLDDIMSYENLDFYHCPNCGGEIEPVHSMEDYITVLANSLATDAEKVTLGIVSMASFVGQDVMQRLVRAVLTHSIRSRASDVHIEPQQQAVSIRHRVDGVMTEMTRLPASIGPAIVSAIKVNASMDISEKRKPQDGAWQIMVDDADIDLRIASSPSTVGETITIRILDFRSIQMETKNLGMTKSGRDVFEKAIREPHGLILVTGPTGSGKTTSLYVALRSITTGDKNIISIEDPIEFRLAGVNQIQVNPAAGLTFASGLRSILRQDPDVIMVGEIRDQETAEIAVNAAQTGHLVFSTLHTIDAAATVTRLYDLGISPRQFADALSIIVAQRLIRLVCPDCKTSDKPDKAVLREIGIREEDEPNYPFMIGQGCRSCNSMGYLGRSGIFEILAPNAAIRTALESGTQSTQELRELAIANGMRALREEALVLLKQGMTSAEEVLRVTK